jgi:hypothetical protein
MFIKSVTELPVDYGAVRATMSGSSRGWLTGLAAAAAGDHDRLLVEVGLAVGSHEMTRPATLEVRQPVTLGTSVISLPFHLRMAEHAGLFPELEGGLDAAWLGPGTTHLALTAQYEPPLGLLGQAADGILLHRVAELVAQRFLEEVARRLAEAAVEEHAATGRD